MVSLVPLIFMSGCSDKKKEKKETFKTVEYFIKHKEARETRKKECMTMMETTEIISKECQNVEIAIRKTRPIGKLQDKSSWFQ